MAAHCKLLTNTEEHGPTPCGISHHQLSVSASVVSTMTTEMMGILGAGGGGA